VLQVFGENRRYSRDQRAVLQVFERG